METVNVIERNFERTLRYGKEKISRNLGQKDENGKTWKERAVSRTWLLHKHSGLVCTSRWWDFAKGFGGQIFLKADGNF